MKKIFLVLIILFGSIFSAKVSLAAPYPQSSVITGISWGSRQPLDAIGSDLWISTWADDENMYASWGDGWGFGSKSSGLCQGDKLYIGVSKITGYGDSWSGSDVFCGGRWAPSNTHPQGKPIGMIAVGSTLYMGVTQENVWTKYKIVKSINYGNTWYQSNGGLWDDSLWDFDLANGEVVPAFIERGPGYSNGPSDGYIYGVMDAENSMGNDLYLARVPKSQIMTKSSYRYFAGLDSSGNSTWTSDPWQKKSIFHDASGTGWGSMISYVPGLNRYLLTAVHNYNEVTFVSDGSWGIFDAPNPWGPWTTVAYYETGTNTWRDSCPKFNFLFPQKWMSSDGKTLYMTFSGTDSCGQTYDAFNVIKATLILASGNTPPSASITNPSSDGTSVAKGSAFNFSGTVSDPDNSSLTYGWYIDRLGDGYVEALIKQGSQSPGSTSGSITMTGTKTNTAGQPISLETVGATYNLILKVSDGINTEVQTIRSFILTEAAPYCGDSSCNGTETCSTCFQDCGVCPNQNPIAWWKFNETSGTTASDSSGNGNIGTLINGPVWTTGKIGNALSFDGTNDYVDLGTPSLLNLSTNFSISAWVRVTTFSTLNTLAGIIERGTTADTQTIVIRADAVGGCSANGFVFRIQDSGGNGAENCADNKSTGTWYHLVMVVGARAAAGLEGYVNGIKEVSEDTSLVGAITFSGSKWYIGFNQRNGPYFNGLIDDIRIYNRALSVSEIQTLYNAGSDTTPPAAPTGLTVN